MRKYIEMVVGDEPEKIEELITIQRSTKFQWGRLMKSLKKSAAKFRQNTMHL